MNRVQNIRRFILRLSGKCRHRHVCLVGSVYAPEVECVHCGKRGPATGLRIEGTLDGETDINKRDSQ